jgi:putative peptidoglycan lipid II flippase
MNKVFKSYSILFFITIVIRLIDVAKNLFVASQIGVSSNSDIYLSLISIPDSILIIVGLDSIRGVLNSEYSTIYSKNESHLIVNSVSNLLKIIFWISLTIVVFILIFRNSLVDVLLPGFSESKKILSYQIAFFIFPIFLFKSLSAIINSVFNSIKKFYFPSIVQVVISVSIIASIFLPYLNGNIIFNLSLAFLIGNVMVFLLLILKLRKSFKISFNIFSFKLDSITVTILKNSFSIFVLAVFNQLFILSKNYFVSFFPDGAISAVNYAASVGQFVSMLTFNVVFSILVSDLSSLFTTSKIKSAKDLFFKTFNSLAYIYVPIIIILILFNDEILKLLYMRGNFSLKGVEAIKLPFLWETINLYPFLLYIIPTALFLAKKRYMVLTYAGSISFFVGIILNYLGVKIFGYYGVNVAMVCVSIIYGVTLLYFSRYIIGKILKNLRMYFIYLLIGIITFLFVYLLNIVFPSPDFYTLKYFILKLTIGGTAVFLLYFLISLLFKIHYPLFFYKLVKSKIIVFLKNR